MNGQTTGNNEGVGKFLSDYSNEPVLTHGHSVKLEYADFISSFPWDDYITITYRKPCKDGLYWSKRAWQVLEKFDATRAFVAVESHKFGGIHLHLLSRYAFETEGRQSYRQVSLWKYCFKAFGRTQVESVDNALAVSRYCAKYVVKGNQFEFYGDSSAWLLDK